MPLFPMYVDLSHAVGLLIGGGSEALEKAERLAPFGPRLRVFAKAPLEGFRDLPQAELLGRDFTDADLDPIPDFVIIAGEDVAENHRIAELCRQMRIPVNTVDDPPYCTFQFPALVTRGDVSIGISTAGASPAAAVLMKERIAAALPENLAEILAWSKPLTRAFRRKIPAMKERTPVLRRILTEAFQQNRPLTDEEVDALSKPGA